MGNMGEYMGADYLQPVVTELMTAYELKVRSVVIPDARH